jgi:phosphoribosylaminoimidazolecarboxamide formyltransferase/IMP cyclohydrolase
MSSSGTAKYLKDRGVECSDLADLVGGPILGHRVVSLSREFYAMLLARPDMPEDVEELKRLNLPFISLVCCDMYPLQEEILKKETDHSSIIEKIDIGGPTMLRAGAKAGRIVVADVKDRELVISWLKDGAKEEEKFKRELAGKAEAIVSRYAAISSGYLSEGKYQGLTLESRVECAYGENAWQRPSSLYKRLGNNDPLSLWNWQHIAGNAPSYNNWCDIDRMIQTVTHIGAGFEKNFKTVPYIAIGVKHGNPCGAGYGEEALEVVGKMLLGDLRAIFGGSIMLNFPVDEKIADELIHKHSQQGRRLLDVVAAPSFTPEAVEILSRKKGKCRLLTNPNIEKAGEQSLDRSRRFRFVRGGFLEQPNYTFVPELKNKDLILAWGVGSTSNSNTITLAKDGRLVGNGVGQQDRVGAAKLAILRADDAEKTANPQAEHAELEGAVAYSDSFFPFPDAPEVLIARGVKTIFSTSGSVNDEKIVQLCKDKGVELILLPDAEARGFAWH